MIAVRDATDGDRRYVLSTWVESEEASGAPPGTEGQAAYDAIRGKAVALVGACRVLIAHPEDDAITILAWACVEPPRALHYAYTRRSLRRSGLVRALLAHAGIETPIVTCAPPRWRHARASYDARIGYVRACAAGARA